MPLAARLTGANRHDRMVVADLIDAIPLIKCPSGQRRKRPAKLDRLRRNWLDPEGATEAELKKRTLTNLYNARPQWLRNAHAALDRAVWDAYGWDDPDPATVEEDTILSRLLALNLERTNTGLVAYKGPNVVR